MTPIYILQKKQENYNFDCSQAFTGTKALCTVGCWWDRNPLVIDNTILSNCLTATVLPAGSSVAGSPHFRLSSACGH